MKIAIVTAMPSQVYSGGRYYTWIMAEALSAENNEVFVVTNNVPRFSNDFSEYENHNKIQTIYYSNYEKELENYKELDYVILVPHISKRNKFVTIAINLAIKKNAKLAFINFESPNWFNAYSNTKRDEKDYKNLKKICKYGCIIFSLAKESERYAKEFYNDYPKRTYFEVWSPPINTVVADKVNVNKTNQMVALCRFSDRHKGGNDVIEALDESLRGWNVVLIVGNGYIDDYYINQLEEKRELYGFTYEVKKQLSDYEKFYEIKKSRILLFPSYFEGYGYPPVEAQYCNTICIAYDLPVLRETSGNNLIYCRVGDVGDIREKIAYAVKLESQEYYDSIRDLADIFAAAKRLVNIFESYKCTNYINKKQYFFRKLFLPVINVKDKIIDESIRIVHSICIPKFIKEVLIKGEFRTEYEELNNGSWKKFGSSIKNKKLVVFGTGANYEVFSEKYCKKYDVSVLIDNSNTMWGKKKSYGNRFLEIENPDRLNHLNMDEYVVLIASTNYVNGITKQLKDRKVKDIYSFTVLESKTRMAKLWKITKRKMK